MFPDPLRAFQMVVRTGSIRKAGEEMGLAPSSVSRQIVILERQIGTELFRRSNNGLVLTHAGELVVSYADEVVLGFDSLRSDLDDLRGRRRLIRVAMVESIASAGPAEAISRFRRKFEDVSFNFHMVPAPEVITCVRENRCDIGITFCAEPETGILTVAQFPEPVLLMLPPDLAPMLTNKIHMEDLAGLPLALPDQHFGVRRMFDRYCSSHGASIEPVLETNSFEALRDFVRSGAGAAILPKRAAIREEQAGRARCIEIDHPAFIDSTLDLIMLKQQRVPRLTRLFIDTLRECL